MPLESPSICSCGITGGVVCTLAVGSGNKARNFCFCAISPATAAAADATAASADATAASADATAASAQLGPRGAAKRTAKAKRPNLIRSDEADRQARQFLRKLDSAV